MRKIARAYYASKISPNQARTPEGYLICYNAAIGIGRTGWQEYMPKELGLQGNIPVQLYRSEEEVFNPASIASFEGKPITDEHPQSWVSPENINSYMRGVTTNVRRGVDADSDLLLGDLIIYDPVLISEIEAGKKELSGGYDYDCVPLEQEGRYAQINIRGNHVAIVREGRAGYRVAVKDEKPKKERGKSMAKNNKETIWGKMFKAFAVDAEPEELAEASKMMHGEEKEGKDEVPVSTTVAPKAADAEPVDGATATMLKQVLEKLGGIEGRISALEQAKQKEVEARISWPTDGAPAWKIKEDVVFLRIGDEDDDFSLLRDTVYSELNADNANQETSYTRVMKVHWVCYGPNSNDTAFMIRNKLYSQVIRDLLSNQQVFLVPKIDSPIRTPELFLGQWWDRSNLNAKFNIAVAFDNTVPYLKSATVQVTDQNDNTVIDNITKN